jgi:hypothetical protein
MIAPAGRLEPVPANPAWKECDVMPSTSLDHGLASPEGPAAGSSLPGLPWAVRLAGARSARPALELYEGGILLDVVSSTPIAPQLVRGIRAASLAGRQRGLAWGRLPSAGADIAVEFSSRPGRRRAVTATVIEITAWAWLAVADGRFDRVAVRSGGRCLQYKVPRSRRWG